VFSIEQFSLIPEGLPTEHSAFNAYSAMNKKGEVCMGEVIRLEEARKRVARWKEQKLISLGYPRYLDPSGKSHVLIAFIFERGIGRIMYCFDLFDENDGETVFRGYIESPCYIGFGEIYLRDIDTSRADILLSPSELSSEVVPPPGWIEKRDS
jgi:hypothetical protein